VGSRPFIGYYNDADPYNRLSWVYSYTTLTD